MVLRAPVPRHVEGAGPDVNLTSARCSFLGYVIQGISSERDGPAVRDHPAVQVFISSETNSDDATVPVEIMGLAAHGGAADPIGQRKARLLSATPAFAGRSHAVLAALGGVDTKQPDTLTMDFNSVAVDDEATPTMRSCAKAGPMVKKTNSKAKTSARRASVIARSLSARQLPRLSEFSLCTSSRITFSVISER